MAAAKARGLAVLGVGRNGTGIRLVECKIDGFSQTLQVEHRKRNFRVRLPLVGEFQVENALVAAGLAIATGGNPGAVFAALEGLKGARGGSSLSATARARRSSSTTRTSPMRSARRSRRCGPTSPAA